MNEAGAQGRLHAVELREPTSVPVEKVNAGTLAPDSRRCQAFDPRGARSYAVFMHSGSGFPIVRSLDVLEPLSVLPALAARSHPFMLHSSLLDDRSRWTFFGADPFAVFRGSEYDAGVRAFRSIAERVAADEVQPSVVPFTGGAVGYWSYDFGRRLERLPERAADDLGLPDVVLALYDVIGAFDHRSRQAWLFSSGLPHEGAERRAHAEKRLREVEHMLCGRPAVDKIERWYDPRPAASTFQPLEYRRGIETVKDFIARGDIYQANLSQRWSIKLGDVPRTRLAVALFEALADHSAAPFAAYFDARDHTIVSASPERFLDLHGRRVETRPIKGTRPRGMNAAEDDRLRAELLASAKDRAENVMIVDVLRNDLGRVCEAGSVATRTLCELEAFPQVFHLTSTIDGRLAAGRDAFDLLHACFPGGSITGAPKIRAMEILESLEPVRRHVYTGCMGYLDWGGDADWNIAIRTATLAGRALHFAAGGGITTDSDPDAEYLETLDKVAGMKTAIEQTLGPITLEPRTVPA